MADIPGHLQACLHSFRLAALAILFSGGIVLQILACALYSNWWPMLTATMYIIMPMPLLFFGGGDSSFANSADAGGWVDIAKFLTGASVIGSIAIPSILKHADVIGLGAMFLVFSSLFVFGLTAYFYILMNSEDEHSYGYI
ncbi:vacuolar protein sorting-associated protein 55 homolog [Cryptomeria japonica]|uniref:vacuolar protein sorting-associated protein 55 homolog n=1 Tax=Cryptomeria japonica TaxID=3369 RepID=UPI0027D9D3B6|nr:vacuolar protein sorting-associated protein 55 homolog [Cryptomeria japonica]XP_057843936.2 vacuolar protein sorting-associated protein 55 homolog [Cryptomeria japonica]XP_059067237.1 vacuolar protein sorting-associated protein 55 homolog [Cryptomeria japonica]XP_059067238.1 vacuolar protein sorting-associated protein 55 homolog [Cryptomeria japonica]